MVFNGEVVATEGLAGSEALEGLEAKKKELQGLLDQVSMKEMDMAAEAYQEQLAKRIDALRAEIRSQYGVEV